jgi:hypothetical protein
MEPNWDSIFQKTEQAFGGHTTRPEQTRNDHQGRLDVSAYLTHYGIAHRVKTNGAATYYQLDHCLFDSAHVKDSAIVQGTDGKLGYHCFHDSCRGKTWRDARAVISGDDNLREFVTGRGTEHRKERNSASEKQRPTIELKTMGEIHRTEIEFEPPLIADLNERGDSLIATGSTGLGKSLLVDATAGAVASGTPLFDRFEIPEPRNVLIYQSENSLKATKNRLAARLHAFEKRRDFERHVAALDRIFMATMNGDPRVAGDILDSGFAEDLGEAIELTQAGLVILDPLISYHRQDENANTGMRTVLDRLSEIVGPKTSILITHHHGKTDYEGNNKSRGASAITDWARGILTLTRQPHATKKLIRVEHTKAGNFALSPSFLLEVVGPCVVSAELDVLVPPSKVSEVLSDMGGRAESKNELAKMIMETCEVSRRTAQEAIDRAEDFGHIRAVRVGQHNIYQTI